MGTSSLVSVSFKAYNLTQEEHLPAEPLISDTCFLTAASQCKPCIQSVPRSRPTLSPVSPGLRGFPQRFASWMGREGEQLCEQTDAGKNTMFQHTENKVNEAIVHPHLIESGGRGPDGLF